MAEMPSSQLERDTEMQLFLPTPPGAAMSNTTLFGDTATHGPSPWQGSEDLFALLTSDHSQWLVNPELPFVDMSFPDLSAGRPSDVQQTSTSSSRARHAMQNMSNMIKDLVRTVIASQRLC